ncbi:MAG: methyltransferase domain-containing protein [Alphaproteobacteria bacterium]|jgi:ubiquinone/menaquinone biosynthesis C-methylase UbiE|nr:methyltransferase [Rhodospirillaceae bacterium]MDP6404620.1 methyltransferase domain-containing protein [Alphaproteobacteria bacterium]MDP6623374.1 methyltransferase domain-containing protein [Alphaproteobacteria bacterium]|tara:strand:+ start:104 stop:856 length:753 start_codon:yes stop_codon:yes gene_type:complete
MKTEWDYSDLAEAYLQRPDYSDAAIDELLASAGLEAGARVCDVGAGVAHLTLKLLQRGLEVSPVEPNDEMRARGEQRTAAWPQVSWVEGTGEHTRQPDDAFDLVTFGSSFNVVDQAAALRESSRILKSRGWFACMWNHRDLDDPLQAAIESAIAARIPDYAYGRRREDQTAAIEASGLFGEVRRISGGIKHQQSQDDCLEAWRSHGTLHRQAGQQFDAVIADIEMVLHDNGQAVIDIPYTTHVWLAGLRD